MSNRVTIVPTRFENVRDGTVSYGVRVYDDDAMTYDNSWDEIPGEDLEVLARVLEDPDEITAQILSSIPERGCYVGGAWYAWEQIQHLWEDREGEEEDGEISP